MSYGPEDIIRDTNVSHETLERLMVYAELLKRWQRRVNLVASSSLEDMWQRHFLDSLQLLPLLEAADLAQPDIKVLDLGSGAGFPGLVLAIAAGFHVELVERTQKKAHFLREVIRQTGASAEVFNDHLERHPPQAFGVVTSRAFASVDKTLEYVARITPKSQIWLLKSLDVDEELTRATISWNIEVESFPSKSDSRGRIIRIRRFCRGQDGKS